MANEPQNPATQDSGSGTSIEKFKSTEDRDKAYLELERFSHTQAQRLAELERKLESIEQPPVEQQDNRSFTDLYPARPQVDQRETELASRLLTKPSEVLREVAAYARQEAIRETQMAMQARDTIARFQADNPDLARHEEIVAMFVRKQPENLSPSERLRRAAPEARKYLSDIAKNINPQSAQLDPETYVESPTSRSSGSSQPVVEEQSDEDELTQMIRDREALQQKKMRV
jgi:hypothetical protein